MDQRLSFQELSFPKTSSTIPGISIRQQIQKNLLSVAIANLCNKPFARLGEAKPTSPTS